MNKDQFLGEWHKIKGKIKQNWGKLTDNDITQINGKREELIGRLQSRYGYVKEKAEQELSNWEKTIKNTRTEEFTEEDEPAFHNKGKSPWNK